MTIIINNEIVAKLLTMEATIDALEEPYKNLAIGEVTCRPRIPEAEKEALPVHPLSGEDVAKVVAKRAKVSPAIIASAKKIYEQSETNLSCSLGLCRAS